MILVTGASGNAGGAVLKEVLKTNRPVRECIVRPRMRPKCPQPSIPSRTTLQGRDRCSRGERLGAEADEGARSRLRTRRTLAPI
jgi:nucleoside-diphosphate-sugar epimerase